MEPPSLDELFAVESALNRSFVACVVALGATIVWTFVMMGAGPDEHGVLGWVGLALAIALVGAYVWYAISAGAAAKALGQTSWHFVVWTLAAPLLSRLPIPVVSTLIAASPLAIKFLLGGQLQTEIRERSLKG